jgi:hypothetical protein
MESRLGVRNCFPVEYLHDLGFLDNIKKRTRWKLGQELVDYIAGQNNPTVVRFHERLDERFFNGLVEYTIIVDLIQVKMMQVQMLELPPFEFISKTPDERIVVEWQCSYCGQVNLVIENLECRKCGAPRKVMR